MLGRVLLAIAVLMMWSCADKPATSEPVAATDDGGKLPDSPGDGETAAKAAGEGQAGTPAAKDAKAAPKTAAAEPEIAFIVVSGALNVRSGAGMKSPVVRIVKKGETVTATCSKGWCELRPGEFAARKFLEPKK
jgi:uncharacterized protein YgiM (DUF1202 family)